MHDLARQFLSDPNPIAAMEKLDLIPVYGQERVDGLLWPAFLVLCRVVPRIIVEGHDRSGLEKPEGMYRVFQHVHGPMASVDVGKIVAIERQRPQYDGRESKMECHLIGMTGCRKIAPQLWMFAGVNRIDDRRRMSGDVVDQPGCRPAFIGADLKQAAGPVLQASKELREQRDVARK